MMEFTLQIHFQSTIQPLIYYCRIAQDSGYVYVYVQGRKSNFGQKGEKRKEIWRYRERERERERRKEIEREKEKKRERERKNKREREKEIESV